MARFERSREGRGKRESRGRRGSEDSPGGDSRGDSRGRGSFEDRFKGRGRRDSGREPKRYSRNRRDFEMTKVTCSSCGVECEVPFKPTTDKPLFCDGCFSKKGKSSSRPSNDDHEVINNKLDKIMKSLDIE